MGKPAARVGDMHTCPMVDPGPKPHVGGPISGPGVPTVFIGGQPAAVVGDMATCTGPPDSLAMGSTGVFIGGKPAARMGDNTAHGGVITAGCPTVFIGEVAGAAVARAGGGGAGAGTSGGMSSAAAAAQQSAAIAGTGEGEKKETETHWLDVKFVDKAEYPITGVGYEFTGTDGKKSTGRLAGDGKIRKDGIDPGNATVKLFSVHNARWSKNKAKVGDKVKLTADVVGYPAGTKAVFEIWERDSNKPDSKIEVIENVEIKGTKVETVWQYVWIDDDEKVGGGEENAEYSSPRYYFTVKIGSSRARSGVLEIKDFIEVHVKDNRGNPLKDEFYRVYLSNGEIRKGRLDNKGYAKIDEVPPARWDVEFLEVYKPQIAKKKQ